MTITTLTLSDQLSLLARQASRMETFGEHDALIMRGLAKQFVALQADRDRLAIEVAQQGTRLFAAELVRSRAEGERDEVRAERDQLAVENAAWAVEVCRLNGVIRDLQGDLEVAQQENSRLENPDHDA